MLRRATSLALVPALACGPSLAQLERGHHYGEAICGAREGAFPEGQVAKVIREALDPAVHVAAVPHAQLVAALGDDAPELQRFVLLRITHDSNTIPLDYFTASFTLRSDRPFGATPNAAGEPTPTNATPPGPTPADATSDSSAAVATTNHAPPGSTPADAKGGPTTEPKGDPSIGPTTDAMRDTSTGPTTADPSGASPLLAAQAQKRVALQPADLPQLAAVFGERLPGSRTVGPGAVESALHVVGVVSGVVVGIASLGLLGRSLRNRPGPRAHTEYPTDAELRRAAPRAARLFDAVSHLQASCPVRPGARCHTLVLAPRPSDASAELALAVNLRYHSGRGEACGFAGLDETLEIALPPGPTLEARLHAAFGDDMRRLVVSATPSSP
ncbi:hypothetical protein [Nannocystis bainbridge]|uniref:Uncharacterized protein n=1 Tax=Nannocystis bainbridge TaxID=2995303 RepID=A0ABT5EBN6_9BACT|nr:hypothetical protein [Nannocystis bainbridge]MDC0722848.1 hypothetical protein [Nannocystis bainbridge]